MKLEVKTKKQIYAVLMLLSALLVYGTAGASDADLIHLPQVLWQTGIGTVVFAASAYKGGFLR